MEYLEQKLIELKNLLNEIVDYMRNNEMTLKECIYIKKCINKILSEI